MITREKVITRIKLSKMNRKTSVKTSTRAGFISIRRNQKWNNWLNFEGIKLLTRLKLFTTFRTNIILDYYSGLRPTKTLMQLTKQHMSRVFLHPNTILPGINTYHNLITVTKRKKKRRINSIFLFIASRLAVTFTTQRWFLLLRGVWLECPRLLV